MIASISLRWRLTAWYVCLLAGVLIVFSAGIYLALSRDISESEDEALQSLALLLDRSIKFAGEDSLRLADDAQTTKHGERFVRLYDRHGQLVFDSSATVGAVPDASSWRDRARIGAQRFDTLGVGGVRFRVLSTPVRRDERVVGVLQIGEELEERPLDRLRLILLIGVPVMLLIASWGGAFLAGRALAPIDRLTRTAQRISRLDLSQRLGLPPRNDELGRLAATFDTMIARLDDAFRRQRQFTADASHELRTPLTAIRGQIEVALSRERAAADYRQTLGDVLAQTERMGRLVADLLALARADADALPLQREPLDLAQLARDAAAQLAPLAEEQGLHLSVVADAPATVLGDEDRLLQVLFNLLDNALSHTPRGGSVTVRIWTQGDKETRRQGDDLLSQFKTQNSKLKTTDSALNPQSSVLLEVSDTGPGIPAEHLAHIFDRFYRVDTARGRARGGAGLGLAIVRALVTAHGGTIEARSQPDHGATFVVRLPLHHAPVAQPAPELANSI